MIFHAPRSSPSAGSGCSITRVTTHVEVKRMDEASWNPRTRWHIKNVVLAFIELDDGTTGVGEAYCDGGTPASVLALIENDLAPLLLGQDPMAIRHHWHAMLDTSIVSAKAGACHAAASALDIALWDAVGKKLGQPIFRLLGAGSDWVPVYASAGLYGVGKTREALAREMAGYVAIGFKAVKIKVGGQTLREDIARVHAVREAIGPDVRLMVDALYSYGPDEALKFAAAASPADIHFLEAPVHPDDMDGLRRVCDHSPIPVAGNEFAYSVPGFRRLIEHGGVQVVHADAILCGGVSGAMRIAELAQAHHLPISFHAASSLVCLMANAHVAAAAANTESVEFHMLHQVLFEAVDELPFRLEDGGIRLGSSPGIGVSLSGGSKRETALQRSTP
jgi:L-alanine-DL-glutamate epimerase-like enolase superfamily enzyme